MFLPDVILLEEGIRIEPFDPIRPRLSGWAVGIRLTDAEQYIEQRGDKFWFRDTVVYDHDPRLPAEFCPKEEYHTREAAETALGWAVAKWARGNT